MKKNLLVLFVGIAIVTISAQIFLNNFIKKEVLNNVSKLLSSQVSLSSVRLSQLSSLILKNIKIIDPTDKSRNIFEIEQMQISFNPLLFIRTKDILKSITSIKITNGTSIIHHYKDDSFNIVSLIQKSEPVTKNRISLPEVNIKLKNCSLTYIDERGFGPESFKEAKTHKFFNFNSVIDFAKEQTKLKVNGLLNKKGNKVEISGVIEKDNYQINIHTNKSEIADIINYFANMPDLIFSNTVGKVDISIKPNKVITKTDLPIAIDLSLNIHKGIINTKWLPPPLLINKGNVKITNKGIYIKNVQGISSSENFEVNGDILDFNKLNLIIIANNLNYKNAYTFLPFLKNWNLNGSGLFTFNLKNPGNEVVLSGQVYNYTGNIFQYKVNNTDLAFSMKNHQIDLNIPKINTYQGTGTGEGTILLRDQKSPVVNIQISINNVSINDYFQSPHFKDKGNLEILLYNSADDLKGTILFKSNTAIVFGQKLKEATLFWNKKEDRLLFLKNSYASLNSFNSKVFFNGYLDNKQYFNITINTNLNPFETDNVYFFSSKVGTYHGEANILGNFKGYYNDAFKINPLLTSSGKCYLSNISFSTDFLKPDIFSGNGEIIVDKYVYINMNLKNNPSAISIQAKTTNHGLIYSNFNLNKISLLHSKAFVKISSFDYSGYASGKLHLFPNKNNLFIKNYGVTGNFIITNTSIITKNYNTQNIKYLSANISLGEDSLRLNNAHLIQLITNSKFDLTYQSINQFSIDFYDTRLQSNEIVYTPSNINLSLKYLDGHISRMLDNFNLNLNIDTSYVSYKSIDLPNFKGNIKLEDSLLGFSNFEIYNKDDIYKISGNLTTEFNKKNSIPFKPQYNFELHFIKGRLENLSELYQRLKPYWMKDNSKNKTVADDDIQKKINILSKYNSLIQKNYVNLYSLKENSVGKLLDTLKIKEQQEILNELPSIEGLITGYLHLSNIDNFQFFSNLSVGSGRIIYGYFDSLNLLARLNKSHNIAIDIKCHNLTLLDNLFQEINASAIYSPDLQNIAVKSLYTTFKENKSNNILSGNINLSSLFQEERKGTDSDLDLHLELLNNDINILSVFNASTRRISNHGNIIIDISGSLQHPLFNASKMELKNFQLDFVPDFPIQSPLKINNASLTLKNNTLTIPETTVIWKGSDTNFTENNFVINGSIFINPFYNNFNSLPIMLNLTCKPTLLDINFENLYVGKIKTDQIYLDGTLLIPLSKKSKVQYEDSILNEKESGPVLKTSLTFSNGKILILGNKTPDKLKPSILFDTTINLGKEIYVTGKDFSTDVNNVLNNISIQLEEDLTRIPLKGSLNTIDLEHKFTLRSGRIVFMNKVFQIMEKSKQRDIFKQSPENIKDNIVDMRMMPDPKYPSKRKTQPYFDLKAYSLINKSVTITENTGLTTNIKTKTEEHLFIIFIEGFLTTAKSFSIEHYLVNNNTYSLAEPRIYLDQLSADQMETISLYLLPVLLKPEFYQSLLSKGLQNNEEANELLRNYSASQINLWIDQQLRPFEKDVANTMGFYDVNIEHNLGGEIINTVPVFKEEQSSLPGQKVQIEYIKDLFLKKLFIKLKTGISQDPISYSYGVKLTEYELAWLLNDYISINYGNHNLQDNVYGAFSINANFSF